MKAENKQIGQEIDELLEEKVDALRIRPPRAIRRYIRDLKAQDQRDKAEEVYQQHVQRKHPVRKALEARRMLYKKIDELLESGDERAEVKTQVEIVWLMDASGLIDDEERRQNLIEIIENSKDSKINPEINKIMKESRDRLQRLLD